MTTLKFVRALSTASIAALMMASSGLAAPAPYEGLVVSSKDALAYCKAGKMKAGDVAYIAGSGGLAQFGPGSACAQKTPTGQVLRALVYKANGTTVTECAMATAATAVTFCNSGAMGTYDIDYIKGKVGHTISGPGYGCTVNFSTSGIGNALCD